MKIQNRIVSVLLATIMCLCLTTLAFAADPGALNGESGKWSQFDETVYDAVGFISDVKNDKFDWPSSGTVLLNKEAFYSFVF